MASRPKAAYSERKRQKSTFILTVNSPVYPPIQGKENRLFLRPFIAAKETGGLDFLIAHALLIVCHSLFEVVIEYIFEHRKIIFPFGAVHIVVDGDKADVIGRKDEILQPPHVGILPAQPGQVFDNHSGYAVILHISHHLLEPRPLKAGP